MLILRNVLINEGVHYETHTFLEYSSFHTKSVNETGDMLEWLVGDTYKFEDIDVPLEYHSPIHMLFM